MNKTEILIDIEQIIDELYMELAGEQWIWLKNNNHRTIKFDNIDEKNLYIWKLVYETMSECNNLDKTAEKIRILIDMLDKYNKPKENNIIYK